MKRPSPSLVISLIALFVALGGTSYAVTQLPRNSVGTAQLKRGAVTLKKIKKSARTALKGQRGPAGATGPQGPQGSQGEPGLPATRMFARVESDGTLLSGSPGAVAIKLPGTGDYEVTWGEQDLTNCTAVALRETGAFGQGLIRRSVSPTSSNNIRIITQLTNGDNGDTGFDIAVFC